MDNLFPLFLRFIFLNSYKEGANKEGTYKEGTVKKTTKIKQQETRKKFRFRQVSVLAGALPVIFVL